MADGDSERRTLVDEIQRRIANLIATDQISDDDKIRIARKVLNLIEHGEKVEVVQ